MKTIIRNFTSTFKRFVTANLLNLFGLSLAFASFFVIMAQVNYDYTYNQTFPDYKNLFYGYLELGPENENFGMTLPRPLCETLGKTSPHITEYAIVQGGSYTSNLKDGEREITLKIQTGIKNFTKAFKPEMIVGSADDMDHTSNCLILPESEAFRIFGTTDVLDKILKSDNGDFIVKGVYKNFAENSFFADCALSGDNGNDGNWNNWNYTFYLRLDNPATKAEVEKLLTDKFIEIMKRRQSVTEEELAKVAFNMVNIGDVYFAKIKGRSTADKTSVYLLICFSLLIIVIAAVNFTNFSLAETPMRIRSINTQKVLGAGVAELRGSLLVESLTISIVAFLLGLLWIYLANDLGLQELVQSKISFASHPALLAFTGLLSVTVGLLAGAYPSYYVTSFPPALVLKGSFGLSPKGRALRTILVGVQFIISFMLLLGVGIMYLQSHFIRTSDYGYDKDQIAYSGNLTKEVANQPDAVIAELTQVPGIEHVSFSKDILSSADGYMGWGRGDNEHKMYFECFPVDFRFLKTMGIRITEGRDFTEHDQDVYIFNEAAKKTYPWLEMDKPILQNDYPVVGICEDIRYSTFRNDQKKPIAFMIFGKDGMYKDWFWRGAINVRIGKGVDKTEIMKTLQKTLEKFTPHHDFNFKFMDQVFDNTYRREMRFTKQILLFSLLAVLISIIGVFGLTMFESEYRRKEIGVRKVFGSSTREILYMFNKRYLILLGICFVIAAPIGYILGIDWLKGFAEKTPISPLLFLLAFLLIALITILTVTYQSWKNANENPINSIKTE
ncbi:MacB-like periplasmic core domain protein [Bacteroidetes bacterium oral taxon 272 str. F0290]|nr:MacB-like periplasmic core domain protein [Bacteroidetes bacterium oral taxon 272 str. F0290]